MPSRRSETSDRKRGGRRDRQASPADPGRMVSDESLAALLERITPANRHQEVDWGQPVGKEVW